jgi:cytosine/adenosine deaminase-related metal-dependent hydrolase
MAQHASDAAGVNMGATTPGLVCAHHHLYSSLARGMPAPPSTPTSFREILEQVWWRLDRALDLEMIHWSAKLGALEALETGTTTIIDHHESPNAIDGSLDVISAACAEVGVRVLCAYGVTDRHGAEGAIRGLAENDRFLQSGGLGYVGVHAAFTCEQSTLEAAADLAQRHGVGVHIHVAEGLDDVDAASRIAALTNDAWIIVHAVHLDSHAPVRGTIVHNPRSNLNNAVGYAHPTRFQQRVALGSDGIGANMFEEFRLAYALQRSHNVTATPDEAWSWLANGYSLVPAAQHDVVEWSYDGVDDPWKMAFTTDVRPLSIVIDNETVLSNGMPTRVDPVEIRRVANEHAQRLFSKL